MPSEASGETVVQKKALPTEKNPTKQLNNTCGSSSVAQWSQRRNGSSKKALPTEKNPAKQLNNTCGSSSVGRASAFQADCREFESRLPLIKNIHLLMGVFY